MASCMLQVLNRQMIILNWYLRHGLDILLKNILLQGPGNFQSDMVIVSERLLSGDKRHAGEAALQEGIFHSNFENDA